MRKLMKEIETSLKGYPKRYEDETKSNYGDIEEEIKIRRNKDEGGIILTYSVIDGVIEFEYNTLREAKNMKRYIDNAKLKELEVKE